MNITREEELMYKVMMAIYKSGIPINFKGSMVLRACLLEAGYSDDIRHTVDIDGNWFSNTKPTNEQMVESLQNALSKNDIDLKVSLSREYHDTCSAGFDLTDLETDEVIFTMDIDVNRPISSTKIYEVNGICFSGVSVTQMLADKISAISSEKVFRRVKDVVDLYYLSQVFKFDKKTVLFALQESERTLGDFDYFLHNSDMLKHSYEKFRFAGDVNKPSFEVVYLTVKKFIKTILPRERNRDYER